MHDDLFFKLEELSLITDEQNEIAEAIGKLTGLPNATLALMSEYKAIVERETELWQIISPRFDSKGDALLAYAKEYNKRSNSH